MRKGLIWGLLLGTLAVVVAALMNRNDGYALIVLAPWRVEMSLNFLVIAIIAVLIAGALLLKLLQGILNLPGSVSRFRSMRKKRRGEQAFLSALRLLLEGHYDAAIKAAERARKLAYASGYADLLAARAAQGLDDADRAALWLGRVDADDATLIAARLEQEADFKLFGSGLLLLQLDVKLARLVLGGDDSAVLAAYGDGGPWYLPTRAEYPAGGYEVDFAFCAPEAEALLRGAIAGLLG